MTNSFNEKINWEKKENTLSKIVKMQNEKIKGTLSNEEKQAIIDTCLLSCSQIEPYIIAAASKDSSPYILITIFLSQIAQLFQNYTPTEKQATDALYYALLNRDYYETSVQHEFALTGRILSSLIYETVKTVGRDIVLNDEFIKKLGTYRKGFDLKIHTLFEFFSYKQTAIVEQVKIILKDITEAIKDLQDMAGDFKHRTNFKKGINIIIRDINQSVYIIFKYLMEKGVAYNHKSELTILNSEIKDFLQVTSKLNSQEINNYIIYLTSALIYSNNNLPSVANKKLADGIVKELVQLLRTILKDKRIEKDLFDKATFELLLTLKIDTKKPGIETKKEDITTTFDSLKQLICSKLYMPLEKAKKEPDSMGKDKNIGSSEAENNTLTKPAGITTAPTKKADNKAIKKATDPMQPIKQDKQNKHSYNIVSFDIKDNDKSKTEDKINNKITKESVFELYKTIFKTSSDLKSTEASKNNAYSSLSNRLGFFSNNLSGVLWVSSKDLTKDRSLEQYYHNTDDALKAYKEIYKKFFSAVNHWPNVKKRKDQETQLKLIIKHYKALITLIKDGENMHKCEENELRSMLKARQKSYMYEKFKLEYLKIQISDSNDLLSNDNQPRHVSNKALFLKVHELTNILDYKYIAANLQTVLHTSPFLQLNESYQTMIKEDQAALDKIDVRAVHSL